MPRKLRKRDVPPGGSRGGRGRTNPGLATTDGGTRLPSRSGASCCSFSPGPACAAPGEDRCGAQPGGTPALPPLCSPVPSPAALAPIPQSRPRRGSRQRRSGRRRRAARMAWACPVPCALARFAGDPKFRTDLAHQPQIPPPLAEPSCHPAPSYRQGSSPGRARIGRSPSLVGAQRR